MEIGIDSFVRKNPNQEDFITMEDHLKRIELADKVGLDYFGLGEHFRREFLDSASPMILAAASQRTRNIRLGSAVTVLSVADPVRVFQNFATLDLLSNGRAEITAGRGSFTDGFPLYGYDLHDYDAIFAEKLDLLLKIREHEMVTWEGRFRPELSRRTIFPRPVQEQLPIWLGVGGTASSFDRAGRLGLPLAVAVIGGETRRFRQVVDLYRDSHRRAGHPPEDMRVGLHSLGYVAESKEQAVAEYYPGYKVMFDAIGKERRWPPVTRDRFDFQNGSTGTFLVADPEEVAQKIVRHSESLGGIDRFTFQMDNALLTQEQVMNAIRLIGEEVAPRVREMTG